MKAKKHIDRSFNAAGIALIALVGVVVSTATFASGTDRDDLSHVSGDVCSVPQGSYTYEQSTSYGRRSFEVNDYEGRVDVGLPGTGTLFSTDKSGALPVSLVGLELVASRQATPNTEQINTMI